MKKEVVLKNGNKIVVSNTEGYCTDIINIYKYYQEDNNLIKWIQLTIWDDISFKGNYFKEKDAQRLEFEFEMNEQLYFCLNRLLDGEKEITIDDDDTYEEMQRYMVIKKEDYIIKIIFVNIKEETRSFDKYKVFIKNICHDSRSKLDNIEIKKRIVRFFKESLIELTEDSHQITLDEYIENRRGRTRIK